MKLKLLTIQFIILFLSQNFLLAQETKSLNDKIKSVEGEANKIVISTTKGEYVFVNEDAEKLVEKLKKERISKKIEWITKGNEKFNDNAVDVQIFSSDSCDNHVIKEFSTDVKVIILSDDDIDTLEDGKLIKINVSDNDGKKSVIVTTKEGDEKSVEKYSGEKAEQYLEELEDSDDLIIDIDVDIDDNKHVVKLNKKIIECKNEKDIKVEIIDGRKKVEVKTFENGEEKVKVYEGDEAEKFLKKEKSNTKIKK